MHANAKGERNSQKPSYYRVSYTLMLGEPGIVGPGSNKTLGRGLDPSSHDIHVGTSAPSDAPREGLHFHHQAVSPSEESDTSGVFLPFDRREENAQDPMGYPAICQLKGFRRGNIPGTGPEGSERCGDWQGHAGICSGSGTKHKIIKFQYSCHHLTCPTCYTGTLVRNAKAASQRIAGYREALAEAQSTLGGGSWARPLPPRHVVLSPPASVVNHLIERINRWLPDHPGEAFDSEFTRRFREVVYREIEGLGLGGAGVVIHLWRTTSRAKRLHNESGSDLRIWDWLRPREDLEDLVVFSPHAHLVAYGSMIPAGEFYNISCGWVYRNLDEVYNLEGLLFYLLGHVQVINGRVSITYAGCLSPRKLKTTKTEVVREDLLCEECGSVMVHGRVDTLDDTRVEELTDRPVVRRVIKRYYEIVVYPHAPPSPAPLGHPGRGSRGAGPPHPRPGPGRDGGRAAQAGE